MRQRVLVGWQVFDSQCRGASRGRQMCPEPGPLHRHTAGVCSRSSRTSERRRRRIGREGERDREREFLHLLRVHDGKWSWEAVCVSVFVTQSGEVPLFNMCFFFFFLLAFEKSVKFCQNVKHNMGDNQCLHAQASPLETSTFRST